MRRVTRTTGTYNLDKILNRIVLNGTQTLNRMVGIDWEMLQQVKNVRGPPPGMIHCTSPTTPEQKLPPFMRSSSNAGEIPPTTTSSATADDSNSGGASRIGIDTAWNHLLATSEMPLRKQCHRVPFRPSCSHVHLPEIDPSEWGSCKRAGPKGSGNPRWEKPDPTKGFSMRPPGGAPGVLTSRTSTLKALELQTPLLWPEPPAPAGQGIQEDYETGPRNSGRTSHNSRFKKGRQELPVEVRTSVLGDSGPKPIWVPTAASLPGTGDETHAAGLGKLNLLSMTRDKCLNSVTVQLCKISVTVTSYQCSARKSSRSEIKGNSFTAVKTNHVNQMHPCKMSNPIRDNVSQSDLLCEVIVRISGTRTLDTSNLRQIVGRTVFDLDAQQCFSWFSETVSKPDDQEPSSGSVLPEPRAWSANSATPFKLPNLKVKDGHRCCLSKNRDVQLTPTILVPHEGEQDEDKVLLMDAKFLCGGTRPAYELSATLTGDILPDRTAIPPTRVFPETGHYTTNGALFHFQCLFYDVSSPRVSDTKRNVGSECLSEMIGDDMTILEQEDQKLAPGRSLRKPWPLHGLPPSRRDLKSLIAVHYEQNDPVSSIPCHHAHPFPSHPDSDVINTLWLKETIRPFHRPSSLCRKEDPTRGAQQIPGLLLIPSILTAAPTTLLTPPLGPWPPPVLNHPRSRPLPLASMHPRSHFHALLLGLAITSSFGLTPQCLILGSLTGLLSVAAADRFTLRNGYGTVEARYHLTAYDCSDP